MGRILSVIRAKSSLDCLPCDRVNLDYGNFGDYQDADQHPAERPFERPPLPTNRRDLTEVPAGVPSILRFFLDGSRRTYKIADIILDGRHYLPVVAGQIGVAVVERSDNGKTVEPLRRFCRFVNAIAFPDSIGSDELHELQTEVNRHVPVHREKYMHNRVKDWRKLFRRLTNGTRIEFLDLLVRLNGLRDKKPEIKKESQFRDLLEHYYPRGRVPRE